MRRPKLSTKEVQRLEEEGCQYIQDGVWGRGGRTCGLYKFNLNGWVTINGELGFKNTLVTREDILSGNARGSTHVRFIVVLNVADVMEASEA